jgi:hypothetical protein
MSNRQIGATIVDAPPTVAMGAALTVTLPGGAQLVLQTHVDRDASPADHAALVDRLVAAGNRSWAHYRIKELREKIAHKAGLVALAENDWQRKQREYTEGSEKRAREVDLIRQADQATFGASDKRGEYQPSHNAVSRVQAFQAEQKSADEKFEALKLQQVSALKDVETEVAGWQREIEQLEAGLAATCSGADN